MTTTAQGIDGKVLALRLLREGLHVKLISDRTALEVREISDVAQRNGMSIDEDGVPHIARPSAPTGGPSMRPVVVPSPPPRDTSPHDVSQNVTSVRPAVRDPLVAARASSSKGTVAMAARADALLAQIRERVLAEEKAEAEREEKRRAREVAQAEVERLRAQLRKAEQAARATTRRAPTGGVHVPPHDKWAPDYPVEEVKAWAREHGLNARGRFVARDVVAAWREATGGGA